jgi:hypothetical protein
MLSNDEILGLWAEGRPQAPARPVLGSRKVVAFARAVERAAYERAKEACAITCAKKHADAAAFRSTTKAYIAACDDCADAISALGGQ